MHLPADVSSAEVSLRSCTFSLQSSVWVSFTVSPSLQSKGSVIRDEIQMFRVYPGLMIS